MLKHLVHSHHSKLHTFDDFYNNNSTTNSKTIKSRSSSNDLISTANNYSSSPSPTSPSSPNSNPYTFYNVFSDFKSTTTPDVVIEEDETEDDNQLEPPEPQSPAPVFYIGDDHLHHHHHQQQPQTSSSSSGSSSPHWPTLLLNRFRHSNPNNHGIVKQISVNENQFTSTKMRKSEDIDPFIGKHRYLKRSETINNDNSLSDKKSSNDDFPELSFPLNNNIAKKHRSFASLFHHFHNNNNHHHNHHHQNTPSPKDPNKSKSTGTLNTEAANHHNEVSRPKLMRQKTLPSSNDLNSPVKKSPSSPILPKLASIFHRQPHHHHHHHSSEHHKYRIKNLKARLHHRRNSPPLTNTAPRFHCQLSNELIQEVQQLEEERDNQKAIFEAQRSVKPVVMKRVHTWHNTFNLRPIDQCLEY